MKKVYGLKKKVYGMIKLFLRKGIYTEILKTARNFGFTGGESKVEIFGLRNLCMIPNGQLISILLSEWKPPAL